MHIRLDDLMGPEVVAILEERLQNMHQWSPPESVRALELDRLRGSEDPHGAFMQLNLGAAFPVRCLSR